MQGLEFFFGADWTELDGTGRDWTGLDWTEDLAVGCGKNVVD